MSSGSAPPGFLRLTYHTDARFSVAHRLTRVLILLSLGIVTPALCLVPSGAPRATAQPAPEAKRTVFLIGEMPEESQIGLLANLAASGHPGIALIDTPQFNKYLRAFIEA